MIVVGVFYAILIGMFVSATSRVAERGGVETYEYRNSDSSDSGFSNESGSSSNVDPEMFMEEFGAGGWILIGLLCLWALFTFIPNLAVAVRRLHDQDKSGWMILLALIPLVGGIIVLVFMLLDGTRGPNQYGPDPKGPAHGDTFG